MNTFIYPQGPISQFKVLSQGAVHVFSFISSLIISSSPSTSLLSTGNPRFNATIWQLEPARTFLLLCGFEEQVLYDKDIPLQSIAAEENNVLIVHIWCKNRELDRA